MDPSDAIVNAIMADSASGPAFASSSVSNVMTDQQKKIERRAARLKATLSQNEKNKTINKLVRPGENRPRLPPDVVAKIKKQVGNEELPDLPPDALRVVSKYLVKFDDRHRKMIQQELDWNKEYFLERQQRLKELTEELECEYTLEQELKVNEGYSDEQIEEEIKKMKYSASYIKNKSLPKYQKEIEELTRELENYDKNVAGT